MKWGKMPEKIKKYNYLDLFSGIGGFALGAEWAGMKWENHFFSEVNPYCVELYKQNFPSISLGDIKKIKGDYLPYGEWIITGGFPCQDLSLAGKQAGLTGPRSSLWFEMLRIISQLRPAYAIIENVPGFISSGGINTALAGLAEIGYDAEWQTISAKKIGAWHIRERVWIVAYPDQNRIRLQRPRIRTNINRGSKKNVAYPQLQRGRKSSKGVESKQFNEDGSAGRNEFFTNPDTQGLQKPTQGQFASVSGPKKKLKGCESSGENTKRKPRQGWETEPGICRVVDGLPGRADRIKGLGNSIVPQIAEIIFNRIFK